MTLSIPETEKKHIIKKKEVKEVSFVLDISVADFEVVVNHNKHKGSIELLTVIKDDISEAIASVIEELEKDIGFKLDLGKRLLAYLNSKELKNKYTDVLTIPVEELSFQKYIKKALIRDGYNTIRDVASLTKMQLMCFPEFGEGSAKEIEKVLRELGVQLKKDW